MRYIALIVLALVLAGCGGAPSPMQKWQAGPGGKCLAKVETDLTATSGSFASESKAVFADAANCAVHPPPAAGSLFTTVLEDISVGAMFSGALPSLSGGDFAKAASIGNKSFTEARAKLKQAPPDATWAPGLAKALTG